MTRASGWAGGSGRTGFNEQLHHLWRTRPVRQPRLGPFAGVAAGFGQRYGVDPVLIRVAFVVSTLFGGAGIVLYLAAWLFLPSADDQVSPVEGLLNKGHATQSPTKTIVLIVALAIAISTMGPVGVGLGGSGLISFVLMLAGWWLLYLRQAEPPVGYAGLPDGDIAATGYPGTMFPGGSPWAASPYGPYTKLPDHYEPDQPKAAAGPNVSETAPTEVVSRDTEVLPRDTAVLPRDEATDADTAVLRHDAPTGKQDAADETTVVLGKAPAPADKSEAAQRITPGAPPTRTVSDPLRFGPTPPGWDPLGVAPLAWDLPEPAPARPVVAPPPPRRPRSRLTPVVIGLAILAAAAAGVVAASGIEWMTPARIGAVALAVVGLGLVVGAFLRRGWGLMVVLAPLAGFVILASLVGPIQFDQGAMGDQEWKPTTTSELLPAYSVSMGSGTLDLRSLNLTEDKTVHVPVKMGDARILVPSNMRLHAICNTKMGNAQCPSGYSGPPSGPTLTLNVVVHAGNAEVIHE
ncbi:PspC domain-containing protein [Nocardia sp. CDC159]|uniref:PspC domain-containing protein n=1 Tax=Nocardia pulmonis TaxID=2951408 RepID=A0A9X2E9E5_9NOCA|nr:MULTISPECIES: PspC domain-containing protein [Nocardia]MCM6776194.1 PspC domain-containing protein [Nocardia pulmonis]MCM6788480.1 PspC domain-containing protein [Nocardia sp. CDC159]